MANRSGRAVRLEDRDVRRYLEQLDELAETTRNLTNMRLRGYAQSIAETIVPDVRAAVASSPAPQAAAVAATVRSVRDRMVVVRVGAVNPKLSGFRRSKANRRYRGSLAWGVERGNYPGSRNEYRLGRGTYGVGRRLAAIVSKVADEYAELMLEVARAHGFE